MSRVIAILCFALVLTFSAFAGPFDAREVARINNCQPKKVEVVQNILGNQGKTVYRVTCNLPKMAGEGEAGVDAVLIGCDQSLCEYIRAVSAEK